MDFLDEEEVDEHVSSIKSAESVQVSDEAYEGLGAQNGTFVWNSAGNTDGGRLSKTTPEHPEDEGNRFSFTSDRRFKLKDITVMFPEGKLSLITGPTASGKTALLVGSLSSI